MTPVWLRAIRLPLVPRRWEGSNRQPTGQRRGMTRYRAVLRRHFDPGQEQSCWFDFRSWGLDVLGKYRPGGLEGGRVRFYVSMVFSALRTVLLKKGLG